ncbi:MAG TPA: response regulator [Gemmatimonadales bacterium]|jgi:CheY-like chemotaxis protein
MSSGRRVLVIEDNLLNLELVSGVLESCRCDVITARTAEEGLDLAETMHPDLVLLDIRLPGMSGEAAISIIRSDPRLRGLPVIAVTAQVMQGDEAAALQAGFDAFLSKPIDTRRLRDLVDVHLRVRTPR